jgi:hypothetical protein
MNIRKARGSEAISTKDRAEDFVALLDRGEEELLLTALLKNLPYLNAVKAANNAGYDLEQQ